MSRARDFFGTEEPVPLSERLSVGPLSFTLEGAAVRHIRVGDQEILRGIAFLVRDRDWGTAAPVLSETARETGDYIDISWKAEFGDAEAGLDVALRLKADTTGLRVEVKGTARGDFETNRTGLTVLHPAAVTGCPAQVHHSTARVELAVFPDLIKPWQVFRDIAGIAYQREGLSVTCDFEGDIFEMEDQRQWGDASFKTYSRPLALPWPYVIADGEEFSQTVTLRWKPRSAAAPVPRKTRTMVARFPETAIVLTAQDALRLADRPSDFAFSGAQRILCHIDTAAGAPGRQIPAFARLQEVLPDPAYDLELICAFTRPPPVELDEIARLVSQSGLEPASVLVCPSVDRQSTPPGASWPDCPPLREVHAASAAAFPDLPRGGGMVSLFTELNRKRPPSGHIDFVSHGLCPIVHAADDFSVMESLEAVPHITRSARAIVGPREYRIGPATIAMRQNPYGSRTIPNPDNRRLCMTDDDPRHRAAFGAAYAIGLATALATGRVSVWTPAALYGPRGLVGPAGPWPIACALRALADLAGREIRSAVIEGGIATLEAGCTQIRANLTGIDRGGIPAYGWQNSDAKAGVA
ncbi:hypothetical protein AB1M95_14480 [Sulfitobacter sp. LCG007]